MRTSSLFLLTCSLLCTTLTSQAQTIFIADNLNFNFYAYDLGTMTATDHRLVKTGFSFDIYDCVSWHPQEEAFYVGMKKYLATPRIMRYDPQNGQWSEIITAGLEDIVDIDFDLDAGKMYFIDEGLEQVYTANLDGSDLEAFGPVDVFLTGWTPTLAVDETHGLLFFTNGGGAINYTDLSLWSDVQLPSSVYEPGGRVGDLAIDPTNTWLYWTYNLSQEPSSLNRTNLESFATETLLSSMEPYNFLTLYDGRVYWTTTGSIVSSCLPDGSDVREEYDAPSGNFIADFALVDPLSTSLSDPALLDLQVYPNPATDRLVVSLPEGGGDRIELTDLGGKVILSRRIQATEQVELSVAGLPAGNYQLRVMKSGMTRGVQMVQVIKD